MEIFLRLWLARAENLKLVWLRLLNYLQRFLKETRLKNFTALIELDDETRQDIVEKYVLMLKTRELKRTSVRPVLYAIELFSGNEQVF